MNLLTNYKNLHTLNGYNAWSRFVKRGYFMKGTIKSTVDSVCVKCKGKKFKSAYDDIVGYSIPRCENCQGLPSKLKVSRVIPNEKGNGELRDFYRNLKDEPLVKISDCLAVMGKLDSEITNGTYRPELYNSKSKNHFKFSIFADLFIEEYTRRTILPQGHDEFLSPAGFSRAESVIRLHLKPHFKDTDIREIKKYEIIAFHNKWVNKFRTRNLATSQLRTMFIYAREVLGILEVVPVFPKMKRATEKSAEEIPSIEIQAKIISNIKNNQYREMWTLIACFAKRSCEGRAWQVRDWSPKDGILTTQRHFSKGSKGVGEVLLDGRKSIKKTDKKGIEYDYPDQYLSEILNRYSSGKKPTDFIFKGLKNAFVNIETLNEAWNKSARELGYKVAPYIGTKHATLSAMLKETGNMAMTSNFSGHTNVLTLQRYAQIKSEDKKSLVDTKRFRE
jgi:integrase